MSTGVVGGDRYPAPPQYTYAKEKQRGSVLSEDNLNIMREVGDYNLPNPIKPGNWLRFVVPSDIDIVTEELLLKTLDGSLVKHAGATYNSFGIRSTMKGVEVLVFVNNDNIWEIA